MALQSLVERLSHQGVRQIAITWVNHAGESLVKVVPLRQLQHAIANGVGFSPVSDAFRTDGRIEPQHRLTRPDGDLRLRADPDSIAIIDPSTGWAFVRFCMPARFHCCRVRPSVNEIESILRIAVVLPRGG